MLPPRYCLAHGLLTLHIRTEAGGQQMPAALYHDTLGRQALLQGGGRVQRVVRWTQDGWSTWWTLLSAAADGRPVVAALPPCPDESPLPETIPQAYALPPVVALRAACPLPHGTALYLGAFGWQAAPFDGQAMDEPAWTPGGLLPAYQACIVAYFQQQQRALLPIEVPEVVRHGFPLEMTALLETLPPLPAGLPLALGGEDPQAVAALARSLQQEGRKIVTVDPLEGLRRLVQAGGIA